MLHYTPQHVSSISLLIIRRTNCITTASGIVTLCKQPYSMLSIRVQYGCLQRVTIPKAVVIKLVLLMISSALLETCWGVYCNKYIVYIMMHDQKKHKKYQIPSSKWVFVKAVLVPSLGKVSWYTVVYILIECCQQHGRFFN